MRSAATSVSDPDSQPFFIPYLVHSKAPQTRPPLRSVVEAAISSTFCVDGENDLDEAVDSALFQTEGSTLVDLERATSTQVDMATLALPSIRSVRLIWIVGALTACGLLTWGGIRWIRATDHSRPVESTAIDASVPGETELRSPTPAHIVERPNSPSTTDLEESASDGGVEGAHTDITRTSAPVKSKKRHSKFRKRSARQILADARHRAIAGDHRNAYILARRSYRIHPTTHALKLMGVSACKTKQRSRAVWVNRRLPKVSRRKLATICARNRIDL